MFPAEIISNVGMEEKEKEREGGREREGERGRVKVRKYFVIDTKPQLSKLLC